MRAKDVLALLESIELIQQSCNASSECPCCTGMPHLGGHKATCELGQTLFFAGINEMQIAGGSLEIDPVESKDTQQSVS